jgi:hypothetical protein
LEYDADDCHNVSDDDHETEADGPIALQGRTDTCSDEADNGDHDDAARDDDVACEDDAANDSEKKSGKGRTGLSDAAQKLRSHADIDRHIEGLVERASCILEGRGNTLTTDKSNHSFKS